MLKMSIKRFTKSYLIGGDIESYKGTLRTLRLSAESPYCWSLVKGPRGGLCVMEGDQRKLKGFISFVVSPLARRAKRKTVYVILGRSSYGKEDVDEFDSFSEAKKMIGEYRIAMPTYSLRIIKRRVLA